MKDFKLIGSILLIAGTTIGAGMVTLPVVTGPAGFVPSTMLFFICWACAMLASFCTLEVVLAMKKETNFISMSKKTLGMPGMIVCWIACLFLLYSIITAYVAGGGNLLVDATEIFFHYDLPSWFGALPFVVIFGSFIYLGIRYIDDLNRFLMLGLAVAYLLLVFLVFKHVDHSRFVRKSWDMMPIALPFIVTAFGYQIIIPTLSTYLERNVSKLRIAIFVGTLLPLIIYLVWEYLVMGTVPFEGRLSLKQALVEGRSATYPLSKILNSTIISTGAQLFFFFAIVTSFLGASISLFDFLADGLKIKKTKKGRLLLCLLTFALPIAFALIIPNAFFRALDYGGAFGCAILLILLPALMVWSKRYHKKMKSNYQLFGGKFVLLIVIFFALAVIGLKLGQNFGLINIYV